MVRIIIILLAIFGGCGFQTSDASVTGQGPGVVKCTVSGLLSGDCTSASPLTATIYTDGTTVTGTGSAGAPLSTAAAAVSLTSSAFPGFWGIASYGNVTFNGSSSIGTPLYQFDSVVVTTATLPVMAPASGTGKYAGYQVYTLNVDFDAVNITINSGVAIITNGYRISASGTLTNNGLIAEHGNNANTATGGGRLGAGTNGAGGPLRDSSATGNNGGTGLVGGGAAGGNGAASANPNWTGSTASLGGAAGANNGSPGNVQCRGGGGGGGSTGGGTSGTIVTGGSGSLQLYDVLLWRRRDNAQPYYPGTGGGAGAGNGSVVGGGGGGGAGVIVIQAKTLTGTGSIEARGGDGGNGNAGGTTGGGGGGGGGVIILVYGTKGASLTTNVSGGAGGLKGGSGGNGGAGASGVVYNYNLSGDGT